MSWTMRTVRRGTVALAGLLAVAAVCCVMLPRYPSRAPRDEAWPEEKLAESMDPWILGEGFADRLVIEIDWVAGCKPGPHTLEELRTTATKYGPPGRPLDIVLDEEISREEWNAAVAKSSARDRPMGASGDVVETLVGSHAALVREPCDPELRTAHFYILFAPGTQRGFFGYSATWTVGSDDAPIPVEGIVVFHDAHARLAKLWISVDRIEATTIVHEFGHQLGLVANKTHERQDWGHAHCTSLKCLMAAPTVRVYLRNALPALFDRFPTDYCRYCQDDIRRAQAAWRGHLRHDPGYRQERVAKVEAWYWSLMLWPMRERSEHTRMLEQIHEARARGLDSTTFGFLEIDALASLGRFDEAMERLRDSDPDRRTSLSCTLGRKMIRAGRSREAIALFDRETMRHMEEYEFEQSAFVLQEAFHKMGRREDEISLIDEMLLRGPAMSYFPEGMHVRRCELLRRTGRLQDARAAAGKGLGSRKSRPYWYGEAAEVEDASGDHEKARSLLREWLAHEEKVRDRSKSATERWTVSWRIAGIHARLEEPALARTAIDRAGPEPEDLELERVIVSEVPVLAGLKDWERAADLLRRLEPSTWYDPCGVEDLAPMRSDPRYAELFASCPSPCASD